MIPESTRKNESEFIKNLPKEGSFHVPGYPPIRSRSTRDADHVDIIRDMRADGYFDEDENR